MQELLKKHATKIRFALVGGFNTLIDFALLIILSTFFGIPKEIANTISTSVAFIFSFSANKKFTFKSNSKNVSSQLIKFTIVTLFGLWVIQNIIIFLLTPLVNELGVNASISLIITKIIATLASLIWNYFLYSRFVFKD